MVIPDPNLGFSANFDADQFRNAIRFAMQLGAPPDEAKQAKFIRRSDVKTYWKDNVQVMSPRLDRDGLPLDPTIEVRRQASTEVMVDVAIEVKRAEAEELPVGNFRPTKAEVTVLDEQYALIKGCQEMIFNGDRYAYGYEPEGLGLFEVGINTLIFYAIKET